METVLKERIYLLKEKKSSESTKTRASPDLIPSSCSTREGPLEQALVMVVFTNDSKGTLRIMVFEASTIT